MSRSRVCYNAVAFAAMNLLVVGHSLPAQEKLAAPELKAKSVWKGTMEQPDSPNSPYPVILYVTERKGDTFKATTWYPTLGNGLLSVTGKIDEKGNTTFTEEDVIHGKGSVVSGCKYVGTLAGKTWKGVPHFTGGTKGKFELKLVE